MTVVHVTKVSDRPRALWTDARRASARSRVPPHVPGTAPSGVPLSHTRSLVPPSTDTLGSTRAAAPSRSLRACLQAAHGRMWFLACMPATGPGATPGGALAREEPLGGCRHNQDTWPGHLSHLLWCCFPPVAPCCTTPGVERGRCAHHGAALLRVCQEARGELTRVWGTHQLPSTPADTCPLRRQSLSAVSPSTVPGAWRPRAPARRAGICLFPSCNTCGSICFHARHLRALPTCNSCSTPASAVAAGAAAAADLRASWRLSSCSCHPQAMANQPWRCAICAHAGLPTAGSRR